jgi:hypothetical protein
MQEPSSMSSKPIPLSDAQFAAVMAAAAPLQRQDVEGYLELVAEQLRARTIIGDGDVHRAIAIAQKAFFTPPALETHLGVNKYDRRGHR